MMTLAENGRDLGRKPLIERYVRRTIFLMWWVYRIMPASVLLSVVLVVFMENYVPGAKWLAATIVGVVMAVFWGGLAATLLQRWWIRRQLKRPLL